MLLLKLLSIKLFLFMYIFIMFVYDFCRMIYYKWIIKVCENCIILWKNNRYGNIERELMYGDWCIKEIVC